MRMISVGYFASWSIYDRNFNVWNINPESLTHLNYAFANIRDNKVILGDPYADYQNVNVGVGDTPGNNLLHGNFYQLFRLKQQARWLKTGISIGGWTWSGEFSKMASSEKGRSTFVKSAIDFSITYGLDFIDLDWEYPVGGGLPGNSRSPNDGSNLVLLLKEFKRQISELPKQYSNIQVTMAVGCGVGILKNYKIADMDKYIDYYNMMCYDFTGAWSTFADHQSNLFARRPGGDSVEKAVRYAIDQGASPSKLVIGMPIYGRGFAQCNGLTKPFMGTGPGTWEIGIYDYRALPSPANCRPLWESPTNASFCYDERKKMLISYDTPTSLSYKLEWIRRMGLGGVMFWELSADFPLDHPSSLQRLVPLWLGPFLDRTPNQLCYPESPFANINNIEGCRQKDEVRRGGGSVKISPKQFDPPRYWNNPFKGSDIPILSIPRAHYNYSHYEVTMKRRYKAIPLPRQI